MEEETGNELLINTEPPSNRTTHQPTTTNPQPPTQPNPEQKQEATKNPKQEEKKMSEADLSKFSVEELQEALEKKKAEEAKFVLDENDPSNLAKFCKWQDEEHPLAAVLGKTLDSYGALYSVIKYPGKLTKFCWMYTKDRKRTTNKNECDTARIVSVYEDYVVNVTASSLRLNMVLEKI